MKLENKIIYEHLNCAKHNHSWILSLSNHVNLSYAYNALMALEATPFSVNSFFDVNDAVKKSASIVISFDGMDNNLLSCAHAVLETAALQKRNVILDPGGASVMAYRLERIRSLLYTQNVAAIRGSASEIIALASNSYGASLPNNDYSDNYKLLFSSAQGLSKKYNCVVIVNGEIDLVCDYGQYYFLGNGVKLQKCVSGFGITLSHMIGYFFSNCLSHNKNNKLFSPFLAAVSAVSICNYAAELAAKRTNKISQFIWEFIDSLSEILTTDAKDYPALKIKTDIVVW